MSVDDYMRRLGDVETDVAVLRVEHEHVAGRVTQIEQQQTTTQQAVHAIKEAQTLAAWKMGLIIGAVVLIGGAFINAWARKWIG